MAERTREQIIDQAVYALQAVSQHYGPGFNEDGLVHLRGLLEQTSWFTDASYTCDVYEDDPYVDFSNRIVWPFDKINFDETVAASKGASDI